MAVSYHALGVRSNSGLESSGTTYGVPSWLLCLAAWHRVWYALGVEHRFFGLYAIVDVDAVEQRGLSVEAAAEALLAGGATLLQLRAKGRPSIQALACLRSLSALTRRAGVPLIVNDRADWAKLVGAEGVHLGQQDLPLPEVRRAFPGLWVGLSTHNLPQLDVALAQGPDYVALGPIFETCSKANPDPVVGLDALRQAAVRAHRAGIPLVAIGGVTHERAPLISSVGATPAVIGALMPDSPVGKEQPYEEIRRRTQQMRRALDKRWGGPPR